MAQAQHNTTNAINTPNQSSNNIYSHSSSSSPPNAHSQLSFKTRELFLFRKYEEALYLLNEASHQTQKVKDPRVLLNKAVVEFNRALEQGTAYGACARFLESAIAVEALVAPTSLPTTGGTSVHTTAALSQYEDLLFLLQYNRAAALVYARKLVAAAEILQDLSQSIELIDEWLAVRIGILLASVYLRLHHTEHGLVVLHYLESIFPQIESPNIQTSPTTTPPRSPPPQRASQERSKSTTLSASDMKYFVHEIRAKLEYQHNNLRTAKHELKIAAIHSSNHASFFVKAELELLRRNFTKAVALLVQSASVATPLSPVLYFNDMGCIHAHMGKPHTAALYFSQALQQLKPQNNGQTGAASMRNSSCFVTFAGKGRGALEADMSTRISYNLGLQLLIAGSAQEAFTCFQSCMSQLSAQPRFWIRLAECCVSANLHLVRLSVSMV